MFDESKHKRVPAGSSDGGQFTSKLVLYRAANDDLIVGSASFSTTEESARVYLDNPGFGGRALFRAEVEIDPEKVLNLYDMSRDEALEALGLGDPGEIGIDEWVPRIASDIADQGYDWVVVRESFPADTETWVYIGPFEREPEMEPIDLK